MYGAMGCSSSLARDPCIMTNVGRHPTATALFASVYFCIPIQSVGTSKQQCVNHMYLVQWEDESSAKGPVLKIKNKFFRRNIYISSLVYHLIIGHVLCF